MNQTPPADVRFVVGAITAGFLTAVSLVLPWFELSGRKRSSIDLIGSAAALDVIEGFVKVLVVAAWLVIPVVSAAALLLAASGRHRLAAGLLLPLGPIVATCVVLIVTTASGSLAWGVWISLACAVVASTSAVMVLRSQRDGE